MEDHNKYICYGLVMVLLTGKSIPLGKVNAERHTSENLAKIENVESLHGADLELIPNENLLSGID